MILFTGTMIVCPWLSMSSSRSIANAGAGLVDYVYMYI